MKREYPSPIALHIASRIVRAFSPQIAEDSVTAIAGIIDREMEQYEQAQIHIPFEDWYAEEQPTHMQPD